MGVRAFSHGIADPQFSIYPEDKHRKREHILYLAHRQHQTGEYGACYEYDDENNTVTYTVPGWTPDNDTIYPGTHKYYCGTHMEVENYPPFEECVEREESGRNYISKRNKTATEYWEGVRKSWKPGSSD